MKRCLGECGKDRELEEFHRDSGAKDGRKSTCRQCRNEMRRLRYKTRPLDTPADSVHR